MAFPLLLIIVGALLAFYYSGWTFDFSFGPAFLGPMLLVVLGLILMMKKRQ
ncbi:MAG: hypothetical protein QOG91_229 [Candidatus Parcubacteria bacterium]|jgi:hypothetical protein|nr:hypothetical protein [Candidatus Parcubacteria bacterium]